MDRGINGLKSTETLMFNNNIYACTYKHFSKVSFPGKGTFSQNDYNTAIVGGGYQIKMKRNIFETYLLTFRPDVYRSHKILSPRPAKNYKLFFVSPGHTKTFIYEFHGNA